MIAGYSVDEAYEEGSYAWVHFGVRESDDAPVAVKFTRQSDREALARFELENRILRELDGEPGIVKAYTEVERALRQGSNTHYYIMERLKCSLETWLDTAFTSDSYRVKVDIIKQIYATIKLIHDRGYVHRDLHDGNILMDIVGEVVTPKITDFGRAYNLSSSSRRLTNPNRPAWGDLMLPPEIAFGVIDVDDPNYKNGDYYAAGMLVKMIFTGGLDTASFLYGLQGSIHRAKQKATGQAYIYYLSARGHSQQRRTDYEEWCSAEADRFKSACLFDLEDTVLAERLADLVEKSSTLDYNQRETNPDELMRFVNGI